MKVIFIGAHYGENKKDITGFRLLDKDTGEIRDIPYGKVLYVIEHKVLEIEGLEVLNGEVRGSNGAISGYPMINDGKLYRDGGLIVLREYSGDVYEASDWQGRIRKFQYRDLLAIGSKVGVANGKIVSRENGNRFISAIKGSYELVKPKQLLKMSFYHGTLDKKEIEKFIKETNKPIVYTYGFRHRRPTTLDVSVTKEKALEIIKKESYLNATELEDALDLNAFSASDMY